MTSKLNADWHKTHKMPKNPTLEERIQWHAEHIKHCKCRKPTGQMLEELKKHGLAS